jgi:uncharacterized Zn finger protein
MTKESRKSKALRYIAEDRVTVTRANERGIVLHVRGSKAQPYLVIYGCDSEGRLTATCTCDGIADRCSHLEIAKLLHRI